jgi:hypothetical protein
MEPFRGIRPIAPFNDAVLPRRSGFDPPMPQPHVGDRSFEGRASLWMRGIRHRKDHGIIRDRQMKRGQASNRPAQHPGNPAAGARRVDFRVLHSGSQMNQTDRVLPSAAPANRQQLLNIQLDPMASDRNRAALPFFWRTLGQPGGMQDAPDRRGVGGGNTRPPILRTAFGAVPGMRLPFRDHGVTSDVGHDSPPMGARPAGAISGVRTGDPALDRAAMHAKLTGQRGLTHPGTMQVLDAGTLHAGQGRLR